MKLCILVPFNLRVGVVVVGIDSVDLTTLA